MKYTVYLLLMLGLVACGDSGDPEPEPPLGTPATEHHPNDGATKNTDGSTKVTLGNIDFNTVARDFSSEPVVTDDKTIMATLEESYPFSISLESFRVVGDQVIGYLQEDAFTTNLVVYNTSSKSETSTHAPDFYIAGFDYNGAIMTVEGAEDLNFYKIDGNGVIADHFFQVKAFRGSKFLSTCYMDDEIAFVFNSDEILMFPIHETTNVSRLMSIPSFTQVSFAADETYLYVGIGDIDDSEIRYVKKSDMTVEKTVNVTGARIESMSVDGNYLYLADSRNDRVVVINKRTETNSGEVAAPDITAVEKVGDKLYLFRKDSNVLEEYTVAFQ